jgi:tetratricopeptide (TPR) repeat protein/predicted Ser/Thr protein kinase
VSSNPDDTPTLAGRPDEAPTIVHGAAEPADAATIIVDRIEGDTTGGYIPKTFGNYRILRVLGEGGMGTVYEAEQDQPRRRVALKVIKPGMAGPELLRRFDLEAQALGRLQHPGIAQIYEAGTADTAFGAQPYFAMEFIEGQELPDYIKKHNPNMRARLKLVALVCEAVHHAHQRGLIHRDLKPRNILVTDRGQPKILDFGVARVTDSDTQATRQTDVGQLIGTLAYMSPEQVLADPLELDIRSDVYALGVILYETLSGQLPYNVNRKLHEAVQVIRDEEPTKLSSINRVYRGDVETIVAKALEKDKLRRYASAADLAADIWRYLDDQPIVARPASTTYQLQKFARRHKALVAGVAAVFVVLVAGVTVSTYQAIRATRAEREAVAERDRAVAAEQTARAERDRATAAEQVATEQRDLAVAAEQVATEQRNIAVAERQRADLEAATALAVNEFIQGDLLSQASVAAQIRPDTKADPDLKVRTALDRAAVRIDNRFDEQPLVEASIRQTIGDTYKALGLYPEAQRHLERALGLQDKALPREHRDRLHTLNNLAEVYWYQGKYEQAAPLFAAALAGRRRVLGENNRETLSTSTNVAALNWAQGKYADAEAMYTRSLEAMRRTLGPQHPDTLLTMNNLALLYTQQGKLAEGQPLYTTALDGRTKVLGPDHPDTLSTMSNLASLYARQGKYDQAEPLFTKATDGMRRVLGEDHPETLRSANNLGFVYLSSQKVAQAEQLYAKTLDTQRRVLGNDHPDTLATMGNLGLTYFAQRKFAQAEPLIVANYEGMSKRVTAGDNPAALDQVGKLIVQLYQSWGRPDKAAEWTQRLRRQ